MSQKAAALALVHLGYGIFPLVPDRKIPPEGMHWREMFTYDPGQVADWWSKFPDDNIGVNCEASGLLVIDLDSEEAADRFVRLWYHHEGTELADSGTPIIWTRPGRWQIGRAHV